MKGYMGEGQSQVMGFTEWTGDTDRRHQGQKAGHVPTSQQEGTRAVGSWERRAGERKQASSVAVSRGEAGYTGAGEPGREGCPQASVWTRRISWHSKLSLSTLSLDLRCLCGAHSQPVPSAPNHYPVHFPIFSL